MTDMNRLLDPSKWYLAEGEVLRNFWTHRDAAYELVLSKIGTTNRDAVVSVRFDWRLYGIGKGSLFLLDRGSTDSEAASAAKAVAALRAAIERYDHKENVDAYLAALVAVGKEHGFSLSHEDGHGSFIVEPRNDARDEWLLGADDDTEAA